MPNHSPSGNSTQLVFCSSDVDPQTITRVTGLAPTESVSIGDPLKFENEFERSSDLGIWKLDLTGDSKDDSVEEQIAAWLVQLEPIGKAFSELIALGYAPYLDCKAGQHSLSLCLEPAVLVRLGRLGISLSIWLYEQRNG